MIFDGVTVTSLSFIGGSVSVFWLVAAFSVFVVAITKSGFGGSMGALSAPIMLTVLPPDIALAVLLPLYLLADVWTIYIWRGYSVWRLLGWMCLFAIIGQIFGWMLLSYIDNEMLKLCIGIVALISGGKFYLKKANLQLFKIREIHHQMFRSRIVQRASIWCSLSGFSSFVSLTGGIPVQVFMLPMKIQRFYVVGTLAWYFLIINAAKVPFFLELDWFTAETLFTSLCLVPVVPFGVWVGKWLNSNISDAVFYHVAHIALIILGLRLVITNI